MVRQNFSLGDGRWSYCFRGTLLGLCLIVVQGCCAIKHAIYRPSLDYFQRYVIVDSGRHSDCPIPLAVRGKNGLTRKGIAVKSNYDQEFWLRAVQIEDTRKPMPLEMYEGPIVLTVINTLGEPALSAWVHPSQVRTLTNGFNDIPFYFQASESGVYRVEVSYPDRNTRSRGLSRWVIVK
jgi:hypothetical protein